MFRVGNSFRDMGAYAPTIRKYIFKMYKNYEQKFSMYVFTFCVHASSFRRKPTYFVSCVKRQKSVPSNAYFSIKICLFYTQHKKYETTLWEHRTLRSTREFFHWNFLTFEILFKTYFKNRKHMLPGAKTPRPFRVYVKDI
jgi:hypothetical protein